MRFKIQVADRETGEESQIEVDALTVQQARARANDAGYLVGKIVPVTSMASAPVSSAPKANEEEETASPSRPSVPLPGGASMEAGFAGGAIGGVFLGAFVGYYLGGPLGIMVGALSGLFVGGGVGGAILPNTDGQFTGMSVGRRWGVAGFMSGIGVAIFCGFCILPLSCWHGLIAPDDRASSPSYNAEPRWTPGERSTPEKGALQKASQRLADISERNRQYAPAQLDRAKEYARQEYEHNKTVMPEAEARRQYDKDLSNIAQEERDKAVR